MKKEINTNGYEYVDLDLPSGTLWATCNVGATKPEESGLYFQWGDTVGYTGDDAKVYSAWETMPFNWGMSYYNPDFKSLKRLICPKGILQSKYDAAHVHMGGDWRMPTKEQFKELQTFTIPTHGHIGNVYGLILFSGKDVNKHIFIPCAGYFLDNTFLDGDMWAELWSSTINETFSHSAYKLYSAGSYICINYFQRYLSANIRGVILNN